jgi:hypothetical protein
LVLYSGVCPAVKYRHVADWCCVLVQVFWPIAVTMLITEIMPTDWTFADGSGAAPVQAALAAVLSVKVISRVPRCATMLCAKHTKACRGCMLA